MEKKLDKIENKIDKIQDNISSINSTLAAQHESLKVHIKRTDLLEQQIEPIKKHVAMVHGGLKLLGLISVLAAIAESIKVIFHG